MSSDQLKAVKCPTISRLLKEHYFARSDKQSISFSWYGDVNLNKYRQWGVKPMAQKEPLGPIQ